MREKNDISFITVDGFNKIDSISTKRAIRKTANKKNKLIRFTKRTVKNVSKAADEAVSNLNAAKAVKAFFKSLAESCRANKTVCRFAVPVISTVIVASICFSATTQIGASATVDENSNDVVLSNAVLQTANDIVSGGFEKAIEQQVQLVENSENTVASDALYGLYVDGVLFGASDNKEELNGAIDNLVAAYSKSNAQAELLNDVKVICGSYGDEFVLTTDEIIEKAKDSIAVSATAEVTSVSKIDYETEYKYDDSEYEDYESVTQKGQKGEITTTRRITYINGEETESEVISEEVTKNAVKKIVVLGTKERPSKGYSAGSFTWPVPYTTYITSEYGPRWGTFHYGIDISDSGIYGQDVVASDGGTVTWAGYDNSGYGYYVIIDHGNGYETLYAHCSGLYVSDGQSVAQGETIAAVGSTGDSTGAHLHFEVSCGGERLDPQSFV